MYSNYQKEGLIALKLFFINVINLFIRKPPKKLFKNKIVLFSKYSIKYETKRNSKSVKISIIKWKNNSVFIRRIHTPKNI